MQIDLVTKKKRYFWKKIFTDADGIRTHEPRKQKFRRKQLANRDILTISEYQK